MDKTRTDFISAMRQLASGVSVVTTDGPAGRAGLTVSAMCSLSADPPALLICINRQSRAMATLRRNGVFCVNVLAIEQMDVARIFAGQAGTPDGDKFASARWEQLVTGAPAAQDALAVFDCRIAQGMPYGSHDILIGAVAEARMREGQPLVYANRAYGGVARFAAAVSV